MKDIILWTIKSNGFVAAVGCIILIWYINKIHPGFLKISRKKPSIIGYVCIRIHPTDTIVDLSDLLSYFYDNMYPFNFGQFIDKFITLNNLKNSFAYGENVVTYNRFLYRDKSFEGKGHIFCKNVLKSDILFTIPIYKMRTPNGITINNIEKYKDIAETLNSRYNNLEFLVISK